MSLTENRKLGLLIEKEMLQKINPYNPRAKASQRRDISLSAQTLRF